MENISKQAQLIAQELIEKAHLQAGQLVVIGCSTSEIMGDCIGTHSSEELGQVVFDTFYRTFLQSKINVAAQCCEHLTRL